MSAKSKEQLETLAAEEGSTEKREIYLREGRTLTVSEDDLVEIRSSSGQVELRIKLTEDGPILQMESVRLSLKAAEAVEIESKRVEIKATEQVTIESEADVKVDAKGEVDINGKMIYLN